MEELFPWGPEASARLLALVAACAAGLIFVWFGISGQGVFDKQVGWLTAGVAALMVELYGLAALVVRARRAVGARRAQLISDAVIDVLPALTLAAGVSHESTAVDDRTRVVVVGLDLIHRAGCPMVANRPVVALSRATAASRSLVECGVCAPTRAPEVPR